MSTVLSADENVTRGSYGVVLTVIAASAAAGSICSLIALSFIDSPLFPDLAVALALAAGCVFGVRRSSRVKPGPAESPRSSAESEAPATVDPDFVARIRRWLDRRGDIGSVAAGVAATGVIGVVLALTRDTRYQPLSAGQAVAGAVACSVAAALTVTAVRYLQDVEPSTFREARALARAGRVLSWIFVAAILSMGLQWGGQETAVRILHSIVILIEVAVCYGLMNAQSTVAASQQTFPVDLAVFSVLGARPNIIASLLDSAERQLGIDLRSTWALAVARQSVEPLALALCAVGWLSTSLTVVGIDEQGLVERFGMPVAGEPLEAGLHMHWPWPIDRVLRFPTRQVQSLSVGHEGEERGGPEDVLWARQHADNEYTLLLGNGRDLITVDASVQFRIADPRSWHYRSQNPREALRAIAYRAVMRTTVNRTLTDALSENVVKTTATMRAMVQRDADALGLGVDVLDFAVGGMHPPVAVARAYEGVVSAEIGKTTAIVGAQVVRNRIVPTAETSAFTTLNGARADNAAATAQATGDAESFRILQSQYRASPEDYLFRRRLEALEGALAMRRFTIVDSRFQRDGGEIWLTQ